MSITLTDLATILVVVVLLIIAVTLVINTIRSLHTRSEDDGADLTAMVALLAEALGGTLRELESVEPSEIETGDPIVAEITDDDGEVSRIEYTAGFNGDTGQQDPDRTEFYKVVSSTDWAEADEDD